MVRRDLLRPVEKGVRISKRNRARACGEKRTMKKAVNFWIAVLFILSAGTFGPAWADGAAAPSATPALAPNLAGSETRLLPANYDIWACDWAPDGKTMVFAGKMQGEDSVKMRIWYWPLDPVSDPAPLTNTDQLIDFSPRYSPDGTKIAMIRRSAARSNLVSAVWLKDLKSGAGRQVSNGPTDRDPCWSPDGTKIVFSRGQGVYQAALKSINLADGALRDLAGREGELLNSPWWGSNGRIYYTKFTPAPKNTVMGGKTYQVMDFGRGAIWECNPGDGSSRPVVADEFDNRLPVLSPDGVLLAFVSTRPGGKDDNGKYDRGSLFIKNLNTGEISFVTGKVSLNGGSLAWSRDGKKLAFFTFRSIRPAIWVLNMP